MLPSRNALVAGALDRSSRASRWCFGVSFLQSRLSEEEGEADVSVSIGCEAAWEVAALHPRGAIPTPELRSGGGRSLFVDEGGAF